MLWLRLGFLRWRWRESRLRCAIERRAIDLAGPPGPPALSTDNHFPDLQQLVSLGYGHIPEDVIADFIADMRKNSASGLPAAVSSYALSAPKAAAEEAAEEETYDEEESDAEWQNDESSTAGVIVFSGGASTSKRSAMTTKTTTTTTTTTKSARTKSAASKRVPSSYGYVAPEERRTRPHGAAASVPRLDVSAVSRPSTAAYGAQKSKSPHAHAAGHVMVETPPHARPSGARPYSARSSRSSPRVSSPGFIRTELGGFNKKPAYKKSDPVSMYRQHTNEWQHDRFLVKPKQRLTGPSAKKTPVKRSKTLKPNDYVVPTDKRRDNLRWQTRIMMLDRSEMQ